MTIIVVTSLRVKAFTKLLPNNGYPRYNIYINKYIHIYENMHPYVHTMKITVYCDVTTCNLVDVY
jgi:sorbitol-specific phosphotransferase system component IIC